MIKRSLIISLLVGVVFLPGCWDSKDVEERVPVINLAIDQGSEEKQYMLSLAVPNVAKLAGGAAAPTPEAAPNIISTPCTTISKGLEQLQREVSQQIYLGFLKVIVISEELARQKGLEKVLDGLMRTPQFRPLTFLLVSAGEAKEIIAAAPKDVAIPFLYQSEKMRTLGDLETIPKTYVRDFMIRLHNQGIDPVLPLVESRRDKFVQMGLAVFRKDKLAGTLNNEETSDFMRLKGKLGEGFEVRCPVSPEDVTALYPVSVRTDIDLTNKEGTLGCLINVKIKAELTERNVNHTHKGKEEEIDKQLAEFMKKRMQKVISKLQKEFKSDALGIGLYVKGLYPEYWKQIDWEETYPEIPIELNVEVKLVDEKLLVEK